MQSIIDNSWQFSVLNKSHLVNVIRLVAPHEQILIEVN